MKAHDPEAWRLTQAAGAALSRGDLSTAKQIALDLVLRRPLDPNANQILGVVALEQGDLAGAKRHLERANQAAPRQANILNTLGVVVRKLGQLGSIDAWRNLGNLEAEEHNGEAAIGAYQKALRVSPNDPAAHAGLARAYEGRHDLSRAKAHAEAALRGDAGNENALLALAQVLLREQDFAGAEAAALAVTQKPSAARANQALAWGVVGEARDRMDDAHGAFGAFTASNRILREQHASLLNAAHLLYHPAGVAKISQLVAATDVDAWPPAPKAARTPAFLVGFPRSGTTLLDQILASHSNIVCIEEREHFANALSSVITDPDKLADFAWLSGEAIEAARADYWRRVNGEEAPPEGALVIDKLPLNIVVLPLIKRVFPQAKIIFALRDPRDVILSCYQQRFGMNAAMAQFLSLDTAAPYYDAIMRLMDLCREKLALDLHQIRYEDVVADLAGAAHDLAAFLGVPFEPGMLSFRETALKRDINTPSARQVIEPLYTRSVGRWKRYAAELAPVLPLLEAWTARYGYGRSDA